MEEGDSAAEVRYRMPHPVSWRHRRWLLLLAVGLPILSAVLKRSWTPLVLLGGWAVLALVLWLVLRAGQGTDFVANSQGITRPFRGGDIAWADVEHVIKPNRFDSVVHVRLRDGRPKATGFPPQYAEQLAKVGHRELRDDGPTRWH